MSNASKTIAAKYATTCPCCQNVIRVGSQIAHTPGRPALHADCAAWLGGSDLAKIGGGKVLARLADRAECAARVEAAVDARAVAAGRQDAAVGTGSLGGSQLAEDMGDFSGRR
jgi:hypothetical protein